MSSSASLLSGSILKIQQGVRLAAVGTGTTVPFYSISLTVQVNLVCWLSLPSFLRTLAWVKVRS